MKQDNKIAVRVIAAFESHFYCYTYKYYQTITTPTTSSPYIREHDHPLSYSYIQTEIPWASWDMGLHQITATIHTHTLLSLLGLVLYGLKISGLKHAHQK
jgi:hypothetical protein